MTLTQLQKDVQTMSFNLGQCSLIDNVLSTNYKDLEELLMMLKVWKTKLDKETDKLRFAYVNARYEELKK